MDIVEILRDTDSIISAKQQREAANEIDRLRAEVDSLKKDFRQVEESRKTNADLLTDCQRRNANLTQQLAAVTDECKAWAGLVKARDEQLAAANGRVELFAWATFDGEGSYDLRLYQDNENYRDEYIRINGARYAGWVIPLYITLFESDKEKS